MFIRDPWTTEPWQQAGSPLTLAGEPTTDQVMLKQLHGLAMAIYQAQQDVLAAQSRNDTVYVQARLQDVSRLRDLFAEKAQQFQSNDAELLGAVDRFILAAGTWIEASVNAFPRAVAAIPNAFLEALALIVKKAGGEALKITLPILLIAGAVLYFVVKTADSSRSVQRVLSR